MDAIWSSPHVELGQRCLRVPEGLRYVAEFISEEEEQEPQDGPIFLGEVKNNILEREVKASKRIHDALWYFVQGFLKSS